MQIILEDLGKRYQYDWIFRGLSWQLEAGQSYALLGHNGSGKSTLMQILSGYLSPSRGRIIFKQGDKLLEPDAVYKTLSLAGPYIDLIEEFSLAEALAFQAQFKLFLPGFAQGKAQWLERLQLPSSAWDKRLAYFSSGMKQRVKLALAIGCDSQLLLLDEPGITLDQSGIDWYAQLLQDFAFQPQRLVVIASNVQADVQACTRVLRISDFKKPPN